MSPGHGLAAPRWLITAGKGGTGHRWVIYSELCWDIIQHVTEKPPGVSSKDVSKFDDRHCPCLHALGRSHNAELGGRVHEGDKGPTTARMRLEQSLHSITGF